MAEKEALLAQGKYNRADPWSHQFHAAGSILGSVVLTGSLCLSSPL